LLLTGKLHDALQAMERFDKVVQKT